LFHCVAPLFWEVLFLSRHLSIYETGHTLNAGTAFGETFFAAPGMARASYARKF
jgi:hypothetical protein